MLACFIQLECSYTTGVQPEKSVPTVSCGTARAMSTATSGTTSTYLLQSGRVAGCMFRWPALFWLPVFNMFSSPIIFILVLPCVHVGRYCAIILHHLQSTSTSTYLLTCTQARYTPCPSGRSRLRGYSHLSRILATRYHGQLSIPPLSG